MLDALLRTRTGPGGGAINRQPSPLLARALPWLSVVLGSALPGWTQVAQAPLVPPLGLLVLIGWVQLRPGLLPPWAGLVLGLVDDLVSGQPPGSAVLLWSVSVLVLEAVEFRLPWRNFITEWALAGLLIAGCLIAGLALANLSGGATRLVVIGPQIVASVLAYPFAARTVAWLDRARLVRLRKLG